MLRITAIAATAVMMTAPAFAMGCNYGKHSASASAETFVPEYAPTAATATTEEVTPLQSAPIDPTALVYESDITVDTVETVIIPEG
jgi:hypothetical protein